MAKHVKEEKAEEKEQSLYIQRGPRDLLDAWYPWADPHIPIIYKASRVLRWRRVPREVMIILIIIIKRNNINNNNNNNDNNNNNNNNDNT